MKKKALLIILLLTFGISNLKATTGLLKTSSIIECNGELFGYHGKDKHYHIAEKTESGNYKAKGDSLGSDWKCSGIEKNINETKELESTEIIFDSCIDGDTANFIINEEKVKVRFLGIDTPETKHPTKGVEEYGESASEYTCSKLENAKNIKIEYEESKTDKYGRTLGWIIVDGNLLQEELVKNGYAEVAYIYGNYKYTNHLCETQEYAIQNNYGIWENGSRKEGYCSTLRTVTRNNENTSTTEDNNADNKQHKQNKEEKNNYTKETIIGLFVLLLALIIKKVRK